MSCVKVRTCKLEYKDINCLNTNHGLACFKTEFKHAPLIKHQPETKPMNYLEEPGIKFQPDSKDEPDANVFVTRSEFQELLDVVYNLVKVVNELAKEAENDQS